MASSSQWGLDDLDGVLGLVSGLYTFFSFFAAILLLPCGLVAYFVVRSTQGAFLSLLAWRYPQLEFVRTTSLRTAIDTHRNQGIISMLLRVRGSCDLALLKRKLQENVLDSVTLDHAPRYPHMKTSLTTRWGRYAWHKPERGFRVENHLTVGSSVFRGRPVSEVNIQEYVSDVVSKYLPPELSPWQLTVIPVEQHFYLLARIHHLLLSEDRVGLGDLLLLQDATNTLNEDQENFHMQDEVYEPLIELGRPLEALPVVFTAVVTWLRLAWTTCKHHLGQPRQTAGLLVSLSATWALALPGRVVREMIALMTHPAQYPGTLVAWGHRNRGLLLQAAHEACSYWSVLYTGPRVLLEELIISHQMPRHQLQTVSLCGRKVVAWSEPVPLSVVRAIRHVTDASQSEIFMHATAGALRDYFQQFNLRVPDTVLATARFFPLRTLLATSSVFEEGIAPSTGGGSLCLALPTLHHGLSATSDLLKQTRTRQPILYLASLWQLEKGLLTKILPTVVVRLILNYLTRRYAVSVTEVASDRGQPAKRQLLSGQQVESLMYWRPPQANICLSLTIITYGESVRLGVMSDALLSPHHVTIVTGFMRQISVLTTRFNTSSHDVSRW